VSASTAGWIAVAAAVLALLGLAAWVWTLVLLRRARAAQKVLLGGGRRDIVDFAVSRTSIVRYDALSDAGGHQSASLAMLDASRTGVVISAIQGRDYARIYVKEIDQGRAPVALSPEEREAVERAMAR